MHVYVSMHLCSYGCMLGSMHVRVCLCKCVYVLKHVCVRAPIQLQIRGRVDGWMRVSVCACMYVCAVCVVCVVCVRECVVFMCV